MNQEKTGPLQPLLSDRAIAGIINDVFGTGLEDFHQVAIEVRQRYETARKEDRAKMEALTTENEALRKKADKWDMLDERIRKCYCDDEGNELPDEEGGDLVTIGELAAMAFGYL